MVAYAKKRLLRWGDRANVAVGDMATFHPRVKVDLAFNVLSTFRHLMTDRQALSHLRLTAKALNPGGIFILGLDLARYGQDFPDEETWVTRRGGKKNYACHDDFAGKCAPPPRKNHEFCHSFHT
jgi:hypothetical protein